MILWSEALGQGNSKPGLVTVHIVDLDKKVCPHSFFFNVI